MILAPVRRFVYRLGIRPDPGTILYSPSLDYREAGALAALGFAEGLDRARKDLTMTNTTTTYTEYGYRTPDGAYFWPDEDGDLSLGHGDYAAASDSPHGDYSGHTLDVESIRRKLPTGAVLVTRRWEATEPEAVPVPLPQTPGSLVRATVTADRGEERGVFFRIEGTPFVWRGSQRGRNLFGDSQLRDVELIHDEGAAK